MFIKVVSQYTFLAYGIGFIIQFIMILIITIQANLYLLQ